MHKQNFGFSKLLNEEVFLYEITNASGTRVNILSFGAAIQSIFLPWKRTSESKQPLNVVLGYSNVEDYEINDCYLGVTVGRVAGRISHGKFEVDKHCFEVTKNHGENCLHGGRMGMSRKNWSLVAHTCDTVSLRCESAHSEEGFPGDMAVTVRFSLTPDNSLTIEYEATVNNHACPINLTNHSYFNLSGMETVERGIRDHVVQIDSSRTLQLNDNLLPSGKVVPLSGPLDLRHNEKTLENQLSNVGDNIKGFDNYYIFDNLGVDHCQATVTDGVTKMSLFTDQVGVQFYTSNFFHDVRCAGGIVHQQHGALCLEAQNYPDAINHREFPSILLTPGQLYSQKTIYKFERI